MPTLAWRETADTFVLVHANEEVSDVDWEPYVEAMGKRVASGTPVSTLVVTPGPGPTLRQRQRLNEALRSVPTPTAVLTGSAIARAVVTILRLRNPEIRAFEPERFEEAFSHLKMPEPEQRRVREIVAELRQSLR